MKSLLQILVISLLLHAPSHADQQQGVVVRNATVYSDASSLSSNVGELSAGSKVSIFSRRGGWKEIFSDENSLIGWVRSYQVREGDFVAQQETEDDSDSRGFLAGLASLSRKATGFFRTNNSGSTSSGTATIGVRGLSEDEIKSAVADFEELDNMKKYASDRKRASTFARDGKLKAKKIAFMAGPK